MGPIWLNHFLFRFDPFRYLEASGDPYLSRYLVGYETFSPAWKDQPTLIFSPAGGGKTALRIFTFRLCWSGGGAFPIHYHLPYLFKHPNFSALEEHLEQLIRSAAKALFLAFAYQPLIFLRASPAFQKNGAHFISTWLPDLPYYLTILRTELQPDRVASRLDRSYQLYQTPETSLLEGFIQSFGRYLSEPTAPSRLSIRQTFDQLTTWITQELGFRAVYLLIDGIDGFPELAWLPDRAVHSLESLLTQGSIWASQQVYLKGFLPWDLAGFLQHTLGSEWETFVPIELVWDDAMLIAMLRRRIYVATDGEFDSLSAVSTFADSGCDLEQELVRLIHPPLPRDALLLIRQVLYEYETRWKPSLPRKITLNDLERAREWYETRRALLRKPLPEYASVQV